MGGGGISFPEQSQAVNIGKRRLLLALSPYIVSICARSGSRGRFCHSRESGPGVLDMAVLLSTTHIDTGGHLLPRGVDPVP